MIEVQECSDAGQWDDNVLSLGGHPLQLWGWGEVKADGNWQVKRLHVREDGELVGCCQLLLRPLPWPLKQFVYAPRGPVAEPAKREVVLGALADYTKKHYGAVSLTIEPDWEEMPPQAKWRRSLSPILMARTLVLDLLKSEEELLSDMTKKTRQYIRKSEKEGLVVRQAGSLEDIKECLAIYKDTARRAGFSLHNDAYYEAIFTKLGEHCQVFMAEHEGRVVAFLWLAMSEDVAFELYGGMSDVGQQLRANYFLKWTAIQRTKEWGVRRYDMNGLLNDGVSKFKQGFASHETMLAGTYEKPLSIWYPLWAKGLPAARKLVRIVKK